MEEINPLRIVEEENDMKVRVNSDNDNDDNDSNGELFDFSDTEELEDKRNSLLIIEDKDLMMGDLNNNHRLSLQVESGDDNSLVMTNEAINRTIIRIGSSVDFGETDGSLIERPHEAINQDIHEKHESHDDDGSEAIVNILGQINDIVGFNVSCFTSEMVGETSVLVAVSHFLLSSVKSNFFCYRQNSFFDDS